MESIIRTHFGGLFQEMSTAGVPATASTALTRSFYNQSWKIVSGDDGSGSGREVSEVSEVKVAEIKVSEVSEVSEVEAIIDRERGVSPTTVQLGDDGSGSDMEESDDRGVSPTTAQLGEDADSWVLFTNYVRTNGQLKVPSDAMVEEMRTFFSQFISKQSDPEYDQDECDCLTGDHTALYNLIRAEYGERIGQYLQDNGISRATLYRARTADLVKRDWHVFLTYAADDYTMDWVINVNPECALFEHVVIVRASSTEAQFFPFSDMAKYIQIILNHQITSDMEYC